MHFLMITLTLLLLFISPTVGRWGKHAKFGSRPFVPKPRPDGRGPRDDYTVVLQITSEWTVTEQDIVESRNNCQVWVNCAKWDGDSAALAGQCAFGQRHKYKIKQGQLAGLQFEAQEVERSVYRGFSDACWPHLNGVYYTYSQPWDGTKKLRFEWILSDAERGPKKLHKIMPGWTLVTVTAEMAQRFLNEGGVWPPDAPYEKGVKAAVKKLGRG